MKKFNPIELSRILSELDGPGLAGGGACRFTDAQVCLVQAAENVIDTREQSKDRKPAMNWFDSIAPVVNYKEEPQKFLDMLYANNFAK